MDIVREVRDAEERIRPYTRETYLERSAWLSEPDGANVFFKMENLQHTGSFKARGAMNKLLSLSADERARGVVTASTGNHGAAVARSCGVLGATCTVFVPDDASAAKMGVMERLGATVRTHGHDCVEAEARARSYAAEQGLAYVPPYNDPQVVGGQGTIAVELDRQLDQIDVVYVSLGGGGLISGIAAYLKSVKSDVRIVGCSPQNSQVMIESVKAGKILDLPSLPTLSDGTAGGIEPGSITFELCCDLVDEYVTVSEDEIAESLIAFTEAHHMLIEGAAAVSIASYLKTCERFAGTQANVVVLLCGANISLQTFAECIARTRS